MKKRRTWQGGYIRQTAAGRPTFIIERWAKGRRVHVSTGCTTLAGAKAELERFELDPTGYEPGGPQGELVFNAEAVADLVLDYHAHQLAKGLTKEWADQVARCLADWQEALQGKALAALNLHRDIKPALDSWPTQRADRIKALKGFYRWLRQEKGLVGRNEDATLDLAVPQARPEKQKRRKVVPPEDVAAVLRHLPQPTRDILHLLTATAWHVSEVRRFAEAGEVVVPMRGDGVLAVLITRHKSGDLTKTPVLHKEHLMAAERLRALKAFPNRMTLARHMEAARGAAGVPYFGMGQMRHSVLTWGVQDGGASEQQAADFAHHRSKETTKRFYLDLNVPRDAIPVYQLLDAEKA